MKIYFDYLSLANLPTAAVIYLTAVCALLGLVMGSALNCCAYRMAHKKSWTKGHSICPRCRHELKARDLIRNYLMSGYESLHTQSYDYVAESTVETLRNWEGVR